MNLASAIFGAMAVLWMLCGQCIAAPEFSSNVHHRLHSGPLSRRYSFEDLLAEGEDNTEVDKRQQLDDYGHMRFGKRDQFDDYGHMRFGRGHE